MPRKSSPRPKTERTHARATAFRDTPRLLSSDEKRELILAHAAARSPQDPLQHASLWAGISVAVLVIAGGWWMTVGREIKDAVSNGGELRKMTEQLNEFADAVDANPLIKSALPSPTTEAAASGLEERIKAALEAASSTGRETDLMAPQAPPLARGGAGTSTAQTESASLPVDPRSPGLSPDE